MCHPVAPMGAERDDGERASSAAEQSISNDSEAVATPSGGNSITDKHVTSYFIFLILRLLG